MNKHTTLKARQEAAEILLSDIVESLRGGYNPIKKEIVEAFDQDYEIDPSTPMNQALDSALEKIHVETRTRSGIKIVLKNVTNAARIIGCDKLPIKDVRKRPIKILLGRIASSNPRWTASTFNHYRKYLSIVFKELVELDSIDHNPITAIAEQKTVKKIREVLTADERKAIDAHLKKKYYRFWLFTNIFFHSGSRETELLKVKGKDVNLEAQYF